MGHVPQVRRPTPGVASVPRGLRCSAADFAGLTGRPAALPITSRSNSDTELDSYLGHFDPMSVVQAQPRLGGSREVSSPPDLIVDGPHP